jgi:hypothetical protein
VTEVHSCLGSHEGRKGYLQRHLGRDALRQGLGEHERCRRIYGFKAACSLFRALQLFLQPLRTANPPVVPSERLDPFIAGVFHNVGDLVSYHRQLLDKLYVIQLQEHPAITSITAALLDTLLNAREAYAAYMENYPVAVYHVEEEMESNATFAEFLEVRLTSARSNTLLTTLWM